MPVALTKYPVTVQNGIINNVFAGFQAVELEFERKDIVIVAVGLGVDSKVLIEVLGNITDSLKLGESIYLFAVGASFTYDLSAKVLTIVFVGPNTKITIDSPFIQTSSDGYINYKQNYFLEAKLVDINNNDILIYPSLLSDDGSPSGDLKINISPIVDFLSNDILAVSGEILTSREQFKVMFREVWREDQVQAFVLIDDTPIVIVYSADQHSTEKFVNQFLVPKLWSGYPFALAILHSLQNSTDRRFDIRFDELDINLENINTNNMLHIFEISEYGFMQANMSNNNKAIEDNTRFLRFNIDSSSEADYATGDYNDTDYLTINTL